jgi:hypothetical protein
MKRTIRMTAHDGNGTRIEIKCDLTRTGLTSPTALALQPLQFERCKVQVEHTVRPR